MTNRSIAILAGIQNKSQEDKAQAAKEIVTIEYNKIIAQAKRYSKMCEWDKYVKDILATTNSEELFSLLDKLTFVEISLVASYGIDVLFMNLIKVSE